MNRKSAIAAFTVLFLLSAFLPSVGNAYEHGKAKGHHKDFESKVFYKAYFLLKNQEELGLTDEQVEKIKDLKHKSKKELIKKEAEIDVLAVDIKAELYKDTVDRDALDALIDSKYELKKSKAKYLVETYAGLKGILTEEQKEKLKTLWGKCRKD